MNVLKNTITPKWINQRQLSKFSTTPDPNNPINKFLSRTVEKKWLFVIFFSGIGLCGALPLYFRDYADQKDKKIVVVHLFGKPPNKEKDEKYSLFLHCLVRTSLPLSYFFVVVLTQF
jgi:hypothetical protein